MRTSIRLACWVLCSAVLVPTAAWAELPAPEKLLSDVGFEADDLSAIKSGKIVDGKLKAATERELVAGFAFLVSPSPAELIDQAKRGLTDKVDENTIAFQMVSGTPSLESFAKLTLEPDAKKRTKGYLSAKPGGDLNLSTAEIAGLQKLGAGADTAAVEKLLRTQLLGRLSAYQAKGLAGIAPYERDGGERSVADELRSATKALKKLPDFMPAAHKMLLNYPNDKPADSVEAFRWSHFNAHGVPTISLTHNMYVPDGDAWLAVQRQFYVSGGYNCEQAIALFVPVKGGTLVVYANHTSTDQVAGFGGGAKRSIGSKLLGSQLKEMFEKIQSGAKSGG